MRENKTQHTMGETHDFTWKPLTGKSHGINLQVQCMLNGEF